MRAKLYQRRGPPSLANHCAVPDLSLFDCILVGWILVAVLSYVALRRRSAAYGRYAGQSKGPQLSARLGWVVMESVSALTFAGFFLTSDRMGQLPALLFFCMWEAHYVHRSWIYPFRANMAGRKMPLSIVAMGTVFNIANGSLNGYWLFHFGPERTTAWLVDPRFLLGAALFVGGMALNISSDNRLLALRRDSTERYGIPPDRGFFRWVSCPNYLGEIIEWCAWALATWSLAGLSFAAWSVGNLAPRALAHHRWYQETFPNYPKKRKALLPFVL